VVTGTRVVRVLLVCALILVALLRKGDVAATLNVCQLLGFSIVARGGPPGRLAHPGG
jgi:hypothetical protein